MAPDPPRGYVADTNVLSNCGALEADPTLVVWFRRYAGLVRVSVVTVAEMHRGLILLEARIAALSDRKGQAREQARLVKKRAWYDEMTGRFGDRMEPIDVAVAAKWAEVSVRFPSLRDAGKAIAATALAKGYGVATENLGDFRRTGVPLVNPFDRSTWDENWDGDPVATLLRDRDGPH
jgi:predicted nucleic acid-binding protein